MRISLCLLLVAGCASPRNDPPASPAPWVQMVGDWQAVGMDRARVESALLERIPNADLWVVPKCELRRVDGEHSILPYQTRLTCLRDGVFMAGTATVSPGLSEDELADYLVQHLERVE